MINSASGGRWFIALGCLMLAVAIAGQAFAAHGLQGIDSALQARFERATQYLIIHGLALIALAGQLRTPAQRLASFTLTIGVMVFSAALALSVAWPQAGITRVAPLGGSLIILSWLALAVAFVLQRR